MKAFRTDWARSGFASAARSAILRAGFAPLLAAKLDLQVEGKELLAGLEPPALFVANHTSHLDAPLILTSLPSPWRDRIAVGAAADHFFDVWWRAAATALAFNAFPVERVRRGRQRGLGRRLLADDWSLLVFPEGTRSRDGTMAGFSEGASVLAVEAGVPIVPIAIRGAYQAMPPGMNWPHDGRPHVSLRFGNACHPAPGESAVALSRRLEARLLALLEEDRTTWWESLRSDARPPEATPAPTPAAAAAARWRQVWQSSAPLAKDADPWSDLAPPTPPPGERAQPAPDERVRLRPRRR
jgi:1-acyl-sn-glycerol-3-phosphate acyltransferase